MNAPLPLEGVRVVEFSHMIMGPSCGLILADLGADVIKVEPLDGDKTRRLRGSGAGYFPMFNRNKRSVTVDLKDPAGIAFARRLIAQSDVVTENFRPGGLDAMGLGYDDLKADNPGLVYCSLKGFLSGPYETRAALDEVVQTMGGLTYMTGPPGQPLRAGTSVNDIMGGMFAAIGVMAALAQRSRTGEGQLVRSSLFENNVFLVGQHMAQYAVTGRAAAPMPTRESAWAVYDLFDTGDGEKVFVGVVSDTQWVAFCREFDLTDLATDPVYATNAGRVQARDVLLPALQALFAGFTREELTRRLENARLPFAPLQRPEDLFTDPHLAEPGAMTDLTLADGQTVTVPALPLELSGRRLGKRLDLPRPGEHTRAIAHTLGYTDAELNQLIHRGSIGDDSNTDTEPDDARPAVPVLLG